MIIDFYIALDVGLLLLLALASCTFRRRRQQALTPGAMATPAVPEAVPPFQLDGSRYDLSTYWGRVRHFWDMVDLRNNFIGAEEVQRSKALLDDVRAGRPLPAGTTDAALWRAKTVTSAVLHPDTGEAVPAPFRLSSFMPVNLPITAGMLLSPPTGLAQLGWQWVNQSYNAGFNYANRNASVPFDWASMALSYGVATTTAMGMAAGLGRVVGKLSSRVGASGAPPSFGLTLLTRGLPWVAVASAGSANALAMRYKEGIDGITVFDASGAPAGTSVAAGRACLAQVALTRVALPVPILLIPPFVLDAARASPGLGPLMARSRPVALGVELAVIGVFLQCALPLAVALFPQRGSIAAADLEPQFRGRKDAATGAEVTTYYYNKGL